MLRLPTFVDSHFLTTKTVNSALETCEAPKRIKNQLLLIPGGAIVNPLVALPMARVGTLYKIGKKCCRRFEVEAGVGPPKKPA